MKCGTSNDEDSIFCKKCGNPLNDENQKNKNEALNDTDKTSEMACPYCGSIIPDNVVKCRHCGEWIDKSKDPSISNKVNSILKGTDKILKETDNSIRSSKAFNDIKNYFDSTDVKHCRKCGASNFNDSMFCEKCGEEL